MTTIKERILGAVTVMNDDDAQMVWEFQPPNIAASTNINILCIIYSDT